jgi:hypothetical protein
LGILQFANEGIDDLEQSEIIQYMGTPFVGYLLDGRQHFRFTLFLQAIDTFLQVKDVPNQIFKN